MASIRTQFSRKLHIAFGVLLIITLAIAWYFFDSVRWYQYDLQRISKSNEVLHGYQELSSLTFEMLQSMTDAVNRGSGAYARGNGEDVSELRAAVSRVRQGIVDKVAFSSTEPQGQELVPLEEINLIVEGLVRSHETIDQALAANRPQEATAELSRLRRDGVASQFSSLIDAAIDEQQAVVDAAHEEAVGLADYITDLLPALMTIMVVVTLLIISLFSRSLTRSVKMLHEAVAAFTSGNLKHRVPDIRDQEFADLGQAFNAMADELSENRANLHDTNVRLEGMVDERTRALQESNLKLAEVDENRRKLLADISHEFRTPLTVIRGESEIALRGKSNTKADYRESLERIIQQADHTTRLVDDLLFIARADAGEPRLEVRSVAIASLLQEVCVDFSARAEAKDVSINLAGQNSKAVVRGDAGRLRQVFSILLDNALRYSHPGGAIQVRAASADKQISITVRDQGIGLTEAEALQAFERFFRGSIAAGHARGTGLGLPVAKAIVEAHGGTISLQGKQGEGAVATVSLPVEGTLRAVA